MCLGFRARALAKVVAFYAVKACRPKRLATVIAMLVLLVFAPGCGGWGSAADDPITDFFTATNVVVNPEVRVLPEDGSVVISNLTANGLTLSGAVPALVPGSVIVSGEGAGLMRRVLSVEQVGDDTILTTEDATFEDVFESADIRFRKSFTQDDIESFVIAGNPVPLASGGPGRGPIGNLTQFPIDVPAFTIAQDIPDAKIFLSYSATGILEFGIEGIIIVDREDRLTRVQLVLTALYRGAFSCKTGFEVDVFEPIEKGLFTIIGKPRRIGQVGIVPIMLLPVLYGQTVVSGSVKAGLEAGGNGEWGVSAGVNATRRADGGFDFEPVFVPGSSGLIETPNFFGSMAFGVSPWQLELQTSLNAIIGPVFKADLPKFAFELKAKVPQNTVDVEIKAIFAGSAGVQAGLFSATLPISNVQYTITEFSLFKRTFETGGTDVEIR